MELHINTSGGQETFKLGQTLGRIATESFVIAMTGDLGSGKTVFVQGLAKGLDVPDTYYVTSPSYTLINEYPGRLTLFHVDLYRLVGGTDLTEIGLHDLLGEQGVFAIEWAERLEAQALDEHLALRIDTTGETKRLIRLSSYGQSSAILLKKLQNELR